MKYILGFLSQVILVLVITPVAVLVYLGLVIWHFQLDGFRIYVFNYYNLLNFITFRECYRIWDGYKVIQSYHGSITQLPKNQRFFFIDYMYYRRVENKLRLNKKQLREDLQKLK